MNLVVGSYLGYFEQINAVRDGTAMACRSMKLVSKSNYYYFGYFDPVNDCLIIKINTFRGDLSDVSAKTAALLQIQQRDLVRLSSIKMLPDATVVEAVSEACLVKEPAGTNTRFPCKRRAKWKQAMPNSRPSSPIPAPIPVPV